VSACSVLVFAAIWKGGATLIAARRSRVAG
jgi:hypothetical protein